MITAVNGFRYGAISRKQAGRYAEEGYQQGAFTFKNAITMYDTGMTRRYPVRTLIGTNTSNPKDVTDTTIYTIHPFKISESVFYVVGFGVETTDSGKRNVVVFYTWKDGEFVEAERLNDGTQPIFAVDTTSGYESRLLTEDICKGMRFAQYYERLYIASHEFRTLYLMVDGSNISANILSIFYNKNGKEQIYFLPDGTILFKGNDGKYYKDSDCTKEYTGDITGIDVANKSQIASFEDYEDGTDLNNGAGTYPNVIAMINDSLYLANTKLKPSTIWKSRTIGSSQWISGGDDYSPDTLRDFSQFQVVATQETKLKDSSEWPMDKSTGYYEVENAQETWYVPDKDSDGNYTYTTKLTRTEKYHLKNGYGYLFYNDSGLENRYDWEASTDKPLPKYDENNHLRYWVGEVEKYPVLARSVYPFPTGNRTSGSIFATDYTWTKPDGTIYIPTNETTTNPVKKEVFDYNLSDASQLYEIDTTVDLVSTDSCGVRMELNTGTDDEVRFIAPGCGKIIVGLSSCEKTLPSNFSAVSNLYSSHYSNYGSLAIEPIQLGRSFFWFTTGRKIREAYLNDGYMEDSDVTALNHDIFTCDIVDTVGKGTPDPSLFSVMSDGSIVQITYDRTSGLNSMGIWSNDNFAFKSLANVRRNDKETLLTLVLCEGKTYICYFYEPDDETMDENIYYDKIGDIEAYDYETLVETVYAEVYDGSSSFGRFKKATTMYIRPYHCGSIYIGNDMRQLTRTNYRLGDDDYTLQINGRKERNFSMKLKSCGFEPMTILAIAWEA